MTTTLDDQQSSSKTRIARLVDVYSAELSSHLSEGERSKLGQFFSSSTVAHYMASLFSAELPAHIRLLDAGAGTGALIAAVVERACSDDRPPESISVTAFEVDTRAILYLEETFSLCREACQQRGIEFLGEIKNEDFVAYGAQVLARQQAFSTPPYSTYNYAILNPPYSKIRSNSAHRKMLRKAGIEASNLYAGFVAIAVQLLEPGGEVVAITPRSFCNGPYFRQFRGLLLGQVALKKIHVFESRDKAFRDADVLQENIIFHATKDGERDQVTISFSEGPEDLPSFRTVNYNQVVGENDSHQFIHIAKTEVDQLVIDRMNALSASLETLGLEVSTGRVVDFRATTHLRNAPESDSVPLIYPSNFSDGFITWPLEDTKKPVAIAYSAESESLLLPKGTYVLAKRFSAKEERRRIMGAIYSDEFFDYPAVGFENHLNVYHRQNHGLPIQLARGLAVYLNSTLVDQYFRQFSGHTQVNATDLRVLKYPDRTTLERLGESVRGFNFPTQDEIDSLLEQEVNHMAAAGAQDPVQVEKRIEEAVLVLKALGLPKEQQNDRSGLTLLALLGLEPDSDWSQATAPLMGITPIMDYIRDNYGRDYAPNTRETIRRQTVHQLEQAGLVIANPDEPTRPTNSPKYCYQVTTEALALLRKYGSEEWMQSLTGYLAEVETLRERYAMRRDMDMVPVSLPDEGGVELSPGDHSELMRAIVEEFGARFVPGGQLLYLGDAGSKWGYYKEEVLASLGVSVDSHGKMPDVILYYPKRDWLLLIEAVTSHGPVDAKRRQELSDLFADATPGLVYVTAFLTRSDMAKYLPQISWETEVWVREAGTHMIHFNGERFLGPYED